MKNLFLSVAVFIVCVFLFSAIPLVSFSAQKDIATTTYVRAKVLEIVKEFTKEVDGYSNVIQKIRVEILEGEESGKVVEIERNSNINLASIQKIVPETVVILAVSKAQNGMKNYVVSDIFRLNYVIAIAIFFFIAIIGFTGKKGVGAILGLLVSLGVIVGFIVPQILAHKDPLFISIVGSMVILVVTTYLAHGFSKKTSLAIFSTFVSLVVTYVFSTLFVNISHLAGLGTEDSYLLELTPSQSINPKGLLLGGIIIGALGALNDITVSQVTAVFALFSANPKQKFSSLLLYGMEIGKEHILSLVNTLVLAYAGTSFPILIFLVLNPIRLPYWTIINSESISEEIIRTLSGSMGLLLAVPISTALAAWYIKKTTSQN